MSQSPDCGRSQLLLIDVQERLLPAMSDANATVDAQRILLEAAHCLEVPLTVSEQYVSGLGPTIEPLRALTASSVVLEKRHFSCQSDEALAARIKDLADRSGRDQLVIAGIEAHVCVLLTALECQRDGLDVHIVADAVTSRSLQDVALGLARAADAGIACWPLESLLFGWCHSSTHPQFKAVSALVRDRVRS
ncbi:MAG: isochorismatase family protein [Pseudomonadota bacterium]